MPPPPSIITREEWGALPRLTELEPVTHPLEKVYITMNTHSKFCQTKEECISVVKQIQKLHMETTGEPDIPYK